jgi:hypothetical protein
VIDLRARPPLLSERSQTSLRSPTAYRIQARCLAAAARGGRVIPFAGNGWETLETVAYPDEKPGNPAGMLA